MYDLLKVFMISSGSAFIVSFVAIASDLQTEVTMDNELSDRQQAIKLRLAGRSVEEICQMVGHPTSWFHMWWRRYRALGPNVPPRRISPELERMIVSIRRRLASQTHPGTRYSLIGASSIVAELQVLHIRLIPSLRTIERVLERNCETVPRVRLAPYLSRSTYPASQANHSNHLHEVDAVGPIYLKGNLQRFYIFVCKDVYDGAVCLRI